MAKEFDIDSLLKDEQNTLKGTVQTAITLALNFAGNKVALNRIQTLCRNFKMALFFRFETNVLD